MHKIRKYEYGGLNNLSQWASMLNLPPTLSTIQSSTNFLTTSLDNSSVSKDWMKSIGKVSTLAKTPALKLPDISTNLTTPVGSVKNIGDLGKFIGGSFNNILGQKGSDILGGLKNFTGANPGKITGVAADLAGAGLEALGAKPMDSSNANLVDKGLDIASKAVGFIPGVGWAASGILQGANLLNKYLGDSAKKQGTADIALTGYTADINQKAGTKYGFTDTVRGWFGKSKKKKANKITDIYNKVNLQKAIPGYNEEQNFLAANNTSTQLGNKNLQQLFGGSNTRMIAAKKGTKIAPAKLRRIVNRTRKSSVNVIPDGVFHSRKNTLPEEISDQVTKKGIPVVTIEEDGLIKQHAEIEKNEIIFRKEATDNIEKFLDEYNKADSQKEKDNIAIQCGKYVAKEILINTDDKTGLIDSVE